MSLPNFSLVFLQRAFGISSLIYSLHKSESERFVRKISEDNGWKVTDIWHYDFPLKATFDFHRRKIRRIDVSFFRIEKKTL